MSQTGAWGEQEYSFHNIKIRMMNKERPHSTGLSSRRPQEGLRLEGQVGKNGHEAEHEIRRPDRGPGRGEGQHGELSGGKPQLTQCPQGFITF